MDKLLEMQVFTAVVEAGSFVSGAETLQMSKAAVSRHIAELESRLAIRLLHRTTRRILLTEEGQLFYARSKQLLSYVEEAEAEVNARRGQAVGTLRVNVPISFGLLHLARLWPEFMAFNPNVILDVTLSDRVVDLVEDGFDMAVRIGRLPASSLISRKLGSTRMILCATPAYLERKGVPLRLEDLVRHDVLSYSLLMMGENWEFEGPDGPVTIKVTPRMRSNSGDTCLAAALHGQGIILQPSFLVGNAIKEGRLVEVLPDYRSIELGIYAVFPSRKFVVPKVRLLIDFLAVALADIQAKLPD